MCDYVCCRGKYDDDSVSEHLSALTSDRSLSQLSHGLGPDEMEDVAVF